MPTPRLLALSLLPLAIATPAPAATVTLLQAGDAATVQDAVDQFRALLGPLNANVPGSFGGGRREINWDAVPDSFSSPNAFPGDFFNFTAAPRARGARFAVDGGHFEVSAKAGNPTATPIELGNINPNYVEDFAAFTPQRIFGTVGSTEYTLTFFVPGTVTVPAGVTGVGIVFCDADLSEVTGITAYDQDDQVIGHAFAPPAPGSGLFSFVGIASTDEVRIAKVVVTTGNLPLAPRNDDSPAGADVVALDDVLFGEPISLACPADLNGDGDIGAPDLAILLGAWGPVGPHPADFNGDGTVGAWDLAWLLGLWGPCAG